jgi:hypothetical protein
MKLIEQVQLGDISTAQYEQLMGFSTRKGFDSPGGSTRPKQLAGVGSLLRRAGSHHLTQS